MFGPLQTVVERSVANAVRSKTKKKMDSNYNILRNFAVKRGGKKKLEKKEDIVIVKSLHIRRHAQKVKVPIYPRNDLTGGCASHYGFWRVTMV